MENHNIMRD